MMYRTVKKSILRGFILAALASVMVVLQAASAQAQWVANGNNINNTNTGNTGVGTTTPQTTLDVSGSSGVTVRTGGSSAGVSIFDRPAVPGDQIVFQGNTGNSSVLNLATRSANFGTEKLSGVALWTVDNTYTPNATQFQLQNSPAYGGVIFTQKFGTAAQGDKKVSFQTAWNQTSAPTQLVLDTNGNVGLGTNTPGAPLEINRNQNAGTTTFFDNSYTAAGNAAYSGIFFKQATANRFFIGSVNDGNTTQTGGPGAVQIWNYTTGPTLFATANAERMRINASGDVGIGTTAPASKLHVVGDVTVSGNISAKYQDVAEWVPSAQKLNAGTVVILDAERNNHVAASSTSYDTRVAGVVSAQPGIMLGESGEGKVLVATTGRVKVKVDASQGAIRVGDLLVTSDREGYAMKSEPVMMGKRQFHSPGTIVGKALEPLAGGTTGEILVLLSLQ